VPPLCRLSTEVSDGEGGFTEVWANIAGATEIPTEITPIKAERRAEMRSWNIIATHYLRVRSNIPVAEVGRAVFVTPAGTRYFYIKTLEDIQTRDIEQFMIAEERPFSRIWIVTSLSAGAMLPGSRLRLCGKT